MSLMRIAQTVKQLGELNLQLAEQIEEAARSDELSVPSTDGPSATTRSELLELVRSVLTDLELLPSAHQPSPTNDDPQPDEDPMPLLFRDLGYAHATIAMKGDDIVVERSAGFERHAYAATKAPEPACHPDAPPVALRSAEAAELPRNTRLVRMHLSPDHQIDPSEVVVIATPADRETAYRYEVKAIAVNDRTIDLAVRAVEPDMNAPMMTARTHVLLFRVA